MATPTDSTTVVSGKTCTRTRISGFTSSTSSSSAAASTTSTSTTSTDVAAAAASSTSSSTSTSIESQAQLSSSVVQDTTTALSSAPAAVTTALAATTQSVASLIATSSTGTDSLASKVPPVAQLSNTINASDVVPGPSAAAAAASDLSTSSSDSALTATAFPSSPSSVLVSSSQATSTSATGSAGLINQGSAGSGSGSGASPSDNGSQANVQRGIVGGLVGAFVGMAMISAIVYICVRKRRSLGVRKERFSEKRSNRENNDSEPFFERMKGKLAAMIPRSQSDRSNAPQDVVSSGRSSVSSVYSVGTTRTRANTEPPSRFKQQLQGFADRLATIKGAPFMPWRNSTTSNVSRSPFPEVVEDPLLRNSNQIDNPFADPAPRQVPTTSKFHVTNPDVARPDSSLGLMTPRQAVADGLLDQQRAPQRDTVTKPPVAVKNPFESPFDDLELLKGGGTPEWLKSSAHQRTQSATTALRSHPPSQAYPSPGNPFSDPSEIPAIPRSGSQRTIQRSPEPPQQPLPPNPPLLRRPSNAYSGLQLTSGLQGNPSLRSQNGRMSNASFFFGEPGPSRPTTMFSANVPSSRAMRGQSDPFDLDRPEILGFGAVSGRREVRASVTRQNSRSYRRSSVPNWINLDDGEYERRSAVPGPLRSAGLRPGAAR